MRSDPGTLCIIVSLLLVPMVVDAREESKNMPDPRTAEAGALMLSFAGRTELDSGEPPRRYLWTDAFAVCNFLSLADETGEERYRELALRLVDQVHHELGRHRDDDPRSGWISGLGDAEGQAHPTRGGLRIGKQLPERGPDDRYDERLEWDRDGQYFHYLSKWMHALDQVSRATGDPRFNVWARELAATAQERFTHRSAPGRTMRMYWKMSIDLTRPLVSSMGQHDPLEGFVTALQLRATANALPSSGGPDLESESTHFREMLRGTDLATSDPLGIGGLLVDAYRVMQLTKQGRRADDELAKQLLAAALTGLKYYARNGELQAPAGYRLAFRELGLAIGLSAVERMREGTGQDKTSYNPEVHVQLEALKRFVYLGAEIETFWRDPGHQDNNTWTEHRDINEVMLATRLAPTGFLVIAQPD